MSFPTVRLTLGQMRRSTSRLAAAGIAIAISTAFVTLTLLAGSVIQSTTYDMIAAEYADADAVVSVTRESRTAFSDEDVDAVAAVDGVRAVQPFMEWRGNLRSGDKGGFQLFVPVPGDPRLSPLTLSDGRWPTAGGETVLTSQLADRLEVGVGDTVTVERTVYPEGWAESEAIDPADELGEPDVVAEPFTVTGLAADPYGAYTPEGGAAVILTETMSAWRTTDLWPEPVTELLVSLDTPLGDGGVPALLDTAIQTATAGVGGVAVKTTAQVASEKVAEETGGQDLVFLVFVMAFAAIALLVAAMVITNTFQVLVAQRTRTLALLRCIGAGTNQLYRSVLLEAAILGLAMSSAGVLAGAALGQAALMVAPAFEFGVPLPTEIALTWPSILLPLAIGTVVTVLAALAPARSATRVAPLAALRPSDAPSLHARAGRARLVFSILCLVVGFVALGGGIVLGQSGAPQFGLVGAVGGGALTFLGVVLSAVLWLPRVAAGLGALVARTGPAPRLAVANTLRNPRRTAATSTALLIGVTFVTMMSTGAASARVTVENKLDEKYPYDLVVSPSAPEHLQDLRDAVTATTAVSDATVVTYAEATIGDLEGLEVMAVDPEELAAVVNAPDDVAQLNESSILLTQGAADSLSVTDGDEVTVAGPTGEADLRIAITSVNELNRTITSTTLARIAEVDGGSASIWAKMSGTDATAALADVQDAADPVDSAASVTGPAAQAADYQRIVDVILRIVVGLLAVAVVIALVGVTNTLSLSVIERTRESATLRAMGLGTGQLRGMLAVEGVLIAGVGALLGIALGLVFGWSGVTTVLAGTGGIYYAVPWTELGLTLAGALGAGFLASTIPARAAARTSPVEALGVE